MCPKCGGPLTASGNCQNLCGGAVVPTEAERAAVRVLLLAAQVRA